MLGALALMAPAPSLAAPWRSALYPEDWTPGTVDGQGRGLQDFSYAGYAGGTETPPQVAGPILDVTAAPYLADNSGVADVTDILQQAIDDAGAMGGGVVYLPAGTYRLVKPDARDTALWIHDDGVVLRGDGPGQTFIFHDQPSMRLHNVITLRPTTQYYAWDWGPMDVRLAMQDLAPGDTEVELVDVTGMAPGQWWVIRNEVTDVWVMEHDATGMWSAMDTTPPVFYRRIESVDAAANTVRFDGPIRYALKTRDNAQVHRIIDHLEGVGVEELSIGNRENTTGGYDTNDYQVPGRGAYELHAAYLFYFTHVVNGWLRNVHTYKPAGNGGEVHLLSNGVRADFSRWVTIEGADFRHPQYEGAGGNGYLFVLTGNDNLVVRSSATSGRHNFSLSMPNSSGNVIYRSVARDGRLPVDFHQRLAPANLIDVMELHNDAIEAKYRDCCSHAHSATQEVIWNARGNGYQDDICDILPLLGDCWLVRTNQFETGYVIGTRGMPSNVDATVEFGAGPQDFVEGEGEGAELQPQSLFEDQRRRRGLVPDPGTDADPGTGTDTGTGSSGDSGDSDGASGETEAADSSGDGTGTDGGSGLATESGGRSGSADGGADAEGGADGTEPTGAVSESETGTGAAMVGRAGCGCRSNGATSPGMPGVGGLAGLALVALGRRRRRSRSPGLGRGARTGATVSTRTRR